MDERLNLVSQKDPIWAVEVFEFLEKNPEFKRFGYLAPSTRITVGYNKNETDAHNPEAPNSPFESMLHYIASSGVNYGYALKQWSIIRKHIMNHETLEGLDLNKIQPKKRETYEKIAHLSKNTKVEELIELNVKGIGIGCKNHLRSFYLDSGDICDVSDRGFIAGFSKFYGIERPTQKQIKEKIETWSNKRVGNGFMFQIFHYT